MPNRVPTHRPFATQVNPNPLRHRLYDRRKRDQEAKAFYNSDAWKRIRIMKLNETPLCEHCRKAGSLVAANVVHHDVELREDWNQALVMENLVSLCSSCHSRLHARAGDANSA